MLMASEHNKNILSHAITYNAGLLVMRFCKKTVKLPSDINNVRMSVNEIFEVTGNIIFMYLK